MKKIIHALSKTPIFPLLLAASLLFSGCGKTEPEIPEVTETESETIPEFFDGAGDEDPDPILIEASETETETETETESESEAEEPLTETEALIRKKTEQKLSEMKLEEKIAQLFYITPEQLTGMSQVTAAGSTTEQALRNYPVGGLIYSEPNYLDPKQLREMLGTVQGFALKGQEIPLFLGVDEEGGRVRRIGKQETADVPEIGSMLEYAEQGKEKVYEAADIIGYYLELFGFNMDFAPVADVLTNPDNEVIGNRSFGEDPDLVSECADAYADALRENGIIPVYKHFPGHGDTIADSHLQGVSIPEDYETLLKREWLPFRDGIDQGIECIMAGHISAPNVTGDEIPATLSEKLITGVLRGDLGFDGIVITDALQMKAISENYSAGDAAVKALLAGCDMLLMPSDFEAAYQGVLSAVHAGTLSENRIDESVRRILTEKYRWMSESSIGLLDPDKGEYFYFIDAKKHWHTAYLDPELPRNDYDKSLFRKENGVIYYDDTRYTLRRGIDVSRHNGNVDFQAVKAAGIDFVILRGAYRSYGANGELHLDEKFHENLLAASAAGLDTGVYVFSQAISEEEAVEEAELLLSALSGASISMPVIFDPESILDDEARTDNVSGEQFTKNTIAFCERVKQAGYQPMVYSNMIWETEFLDLSALTDYPIWYADYEDSPQSPYWFSMWQYAEDGTVPGVDGVVDLDVMFQKL